MPLLGRHKLSNSSSSGQSGPQSVNSTSPSPGSSSTAGVEGGGRGGINRATGSSSQARQVCDSPLFGVRKQISFSGQQDNFKGTGNFITSNQQSINKNLSSCNIRNNNNHRDQNAAAQSSQLNSIPQQITSQQIHYAFSIMDTNQDGMIDLRDLSQMLANLGVPIDEAILSHIMSSVSKRGDHRISEAEFLEWISKFIQVSDQGSDTNQRASDSGEQTASRNSSIRNNSRQQQTTSKQCNVSPGASILRSSTSGFSSSQLIAQPVAPAEVTRSRRGSGSGLALMRSLSSSAANSAASIYSTAGSVTPSVASTSASTPTISSSPSSSSSSPRFISNNNNKNSQNSSDSRQQQQQQQQDLDAIHDLKAAFCVFDLDADGYITIDEVQAGLKLLGESWSPNELRLLLSECSSNSSSPTSSRSQDLNKLSKRQQEQQLLKQRISIDDFVRLLL